jgi:glycine cleavage system H protein
MSTVEKDLHYADSHEWIRDNKDGTVTMGISDHAQKLLGDVVYVELPELNSEITAGDEFALVESVKAASDIYAPISGTVVAINEELNDAPETINENCYHDGWMAKIKISDTADITNLKDADSYLALTESDE